MDNLPALFGFALATSVTPGPNVLMVAAAAAQHGVRPVWPHMLGVTIGVSAMVLIVAVGAGVPLAAAPALHVALKWVGAAWLTYLAWKIASAPPAEIGQGRPPLGFLGAAAFQWVNPKAWLIVLAALPAFTRPGEPMLPQAVPIALMFALVCLPSLLVWAGLGGAMRRLLSTPRRARAFNVTMGLLLLASLLPAVRD
jgi:threonine/homoserine/homoserine lactone efflux protein